MMSDGHPIVSQDAPSVPYFGQPNASPAEMARRMARARKQYATFRASGGIADAAPLRLDRARLAAHPQQALRTPIDGNGFHALLLSCAITGASDVTVQTGQRPRVEIDGLLYAIGDRAWSACEVAGIVEQTCHARNGMAEILRGQVLDYPFELTLLDGSKRRFRVNATGILAAGGHGAEITFRILSSTIPTLEDIGLDAPTADAMSPRSGLVLIAGATGSGKSTTLAALIRRHLDSVDHPVKIIDIQAPIEFAFHTSQPMRRAAGSIIGQSEVGRHVTSFAAGIRSALRRKPHIITVGEARDTETLGAALDAALTGHLVYTTLHAASVAGCMRRLLAAFPAAERDHRACDLAATLRHITVQCLAMRRDGGRIAVREHLALDPPLRDQLANSAASDWLPILSHRMHMPGDRACRMATAAQAMVDAEIISATEADRIGAWT